MSKSHDAQKRRGHPYLSGNFAPIQTSLPLTPCSYTGSIPNELAGGEYVRNGGNPVTNEALGRDVHWFDGDGMLSGVFFKRSPKTGNITPEFVNQYILTDVYIASKTSVWLKTPILPSIATLVNPCSTLLNIILRILRTIALVILSHLPGSWQKIKKISVANTAIYYHDGRALATCESGPPMRFALPGLETLGWFNGISAEGEVNHKQSNDEVFGGKGIFSWMREWATAHPRIDPQTKELIMYHSTFVPPYVNYSIVQSKYNGSKGDDDRPSTPLLNMPVPGVSSAKMMHDFGVSKTHTIIMDLPLSLDPFDLLKNKPVVAYDPRSCSRFGVFPRYQPQDIRWFETSACCIFHTANSWTTITMGGAPCFDTELINMLCCRLTSAALVFSAGNLAAPQPIAEIGHEQYEEEQCRLYYYQFELSNSQSQNVILHEWALAAIPFEFPSLRESVSMSAAKYIYGCSVTGTTFGASLGRAVKINSLVKINVENLIARGKRNPPLAVKGCVDERDIETIVASKDPNDPIQVFMMPDGWYTQESRFVARENSVAEDDGWLLAYVFDESTQLAADGEAKLNAKSELWIIDARNMKDVVVKIQLPQRVPYGLHGNWISEKDIKEQRPFERFRSVPVAKSARSNESLAWGTWMAARNMLERFLE